MNSYAIFTDDRLVVGNDKIERAIRISNSLPHSEYIKDKLTGKLWQSTCPTAMFNVCGFDFSSAKVSFRQYTSDNDGLSETHLCAELVYKNAAMRIRQLFEIYDSSPFITIRIFISGQSENSDSKETTEIAVSRNTGSATGVEIDTSPELSKKLPCEDTIDCFTLSSPHIRVESVTLLEKTDVNDCLVRRSKELIYDHKENSFDGSMFILDEYQTQNALLVVKEAPCISSQLCRHTSDLKIRSRAGGYVCVCGSGISPEEIGKSELSLYGVTVGVGSAEQLFHSYKLHYAKVCLGSGNLFAMSNTWGDRSRDAALCEEFMLRERECALRIGVDVMQIDDGWQHGVTANSSRPKPSGSIWSEGYYKNDPAFWDVNYEKFPSGLKPLMSEHLELALWFSADGEGDYQNYQRDAERLAALSREYCIKQFKLDGMILKNKLGEKHIGEFMRLAREKSGSELTFNIDITAGVRLGYLAEKEIGTIFVENRYTDFVNYYPHTTLKNLWMLSEFFPTRKFQFELLNNTRNADKYEAAAPGDELAPVNYDIDWLFASVMVSNPLIWMEMQHLSKEQLERLSHICNIWRRERDRLYSADIIPLGEQPDGIVYTGFQALTNNNKGYLILLRESSNIDSYSYHVTLPENVKFDLLASNTEIRLEHDKCNKLNVYFGKKRGYAFIKYHI